MEIPAQVFVHINPQDIPSGPIGKSAYQSWLDTGHSGTEADFVDWLRNGQIAAGCVRKIANATIAPGANTASDTYVSTGLSCTIDVQEGETVKIDVRGMVNHTTQKIIHFTLFRTIGENTVDLTPAGHSGLSASRIDISDGVRAVDLQHFDTPPLGDVTYTLYWRNHYADSSVAYLGRRKTDTAMMVPTTMSLNVFRNA